MKISKYSFADELFRARRQLEIIECNLFDLIVERLGDVVEDTSYDPGDESIELHEVQNTVRLTPEQLDGFWKLGFKRLWLNHLDGWETYYYQGGPTEGHRKQKTWRR